ncbi:MAG: hypothetical protein HYX34_07820 [Actinobacteria bacterium]|nr:hypothetical protein [Actinomycetota bacterium]
MAELGAIDEDVPFDWGGAGAVARELRVSAGELDQQRAPRRVAGGEARLDWRGRFGDEFDARLRIGDGDAGELAGAMRTAAALLDELARLAREEQARREAARRWVRAYRENEANESGWNKLSDWAFGEDFEPPPAPPPPVEPRLVSAPAPVPAARAVNGAG